MSRDKLLGRLQSGKKLPARSLEQSNKGGVTQQKDSALTKAGLSIAKVRVKATNIGPTETS